MDTECADLGNRTSDKEAKRIHYNAKTGEGITISTILTELGKGATDPKSSTKQAEGLQVHLKALQQVARELILGAPIPRRYREDAADGIKAAIKKWVADAQPMADCGINYFMASAAAALDETRPTTDLYDLQLACSHAGLL